MTIGSERPLVCSVEAAAQALGIGRALAYRLIREQKFPVPVLKLGTRRLVVPLAPLEELLGIRTPSDGGPGGREHRCLPV